MEWAWAGGAPVLLQARPITALPPPARRANRLQQMVALMAAEMVAVRPYPLDATAWGPAIEGSIVPLFALLGLAGPFFDRFFVEEDGVIVRLSGRPPIRPTLGILLAPLRILQLARRYNPLDSRTDPVLVQAQVRAAALEARDFSALSWNGVLATLHEALALPLPLAGTVRQRYYPRALLSTALLRLALALWRRGDRFGVLLSGVETKTLEANRALETLAAHIRADPFLAAAFARDSAGDLTAALEQAPSGRTFLVYLQDFLNRYGHREAVISTALLPTWRDAPETVLGILKGLATAPPRPDPERPAWEVACDELLVLPLLQLPPVHSFFLRLLAEARCFTRIREDTHFDATLALPIVRRAALELGRRLVTGGVLDTPEEVFHLKLAELERMEDSSPPPRARNLRALVLRRKAKRAALADRPLVDTRLAQPAALDGDILLRGTSGSRGVVEGTVCVVHDASEFGKLRSGEVLVAPYTNPAWTPLFQRAGAVVVDSGGAGSHAAIVAREYGIPAVMGTVEGTRRLVDGQRVRVDGDRGTVGRPRDHSSVPN